MPKNKLVVPEKDVDAWDEKNDEYYMPPEFPGDDHNEKVQWENQLWTSVWEEAKGIADMPSNDLYEMFVDSQRHDGTMDACAKLLFDVCDKQKGIHMKVSAKQFAKVQLLMKDLVREMKKKKAPLCSPLGIERDRQLGQDSEKSEKGSNAQKGSQIHSTVVTKPFWKGQLLKVLLQKLWEKLKKST